MTAEYSQFKTLLSQVCQAYFAQHQVSQFMTYDEALPFILRTVRSWSVPQFENYIAHLQEADTVKLNTRKQASASIHFCH